MPDHKELLKKLDQSNAIKKEVYEKIGRDTSEWEYNISDTIILLPTEIKEKLFPAVCVWGKKS
jgi:hypothetical protein